MRRAGRDAKGGPSGFCIPDLRGGKQGADPGHGALNFGNGGNSLHRRRRAQRDFQSR